jgi:hypothetical protein
MIRRNAARILRVCVRAGTIRGGAALAWEPAESVIILTSKGLSYK